MENKRERRKNTKKKRLNRYVISVYVVKEL